MVKTDISDGTHGMKLYNGHVVDGEVQQAHRSHETAAPLLMKAHQSSRILLKSTTADPRHKQQQKTPLIPSTAAKQRPTTAASLMRRTHHPAAAAADAARPHSVTHVQQQQPGSIRYPTMSENHD